MSWTRYVPPAVPSVVQKPLLAKYTRPSTRQKALGDGKSPVVEAGVIAIVPASVPSLFQRRGTLMLSVLAEKYSVLPTATHWVSSGWLLTTPEPGPGLMSLTML